mmetsp:Transcript_26496/g.44738  ORF Transcript_26496/g.44738 Transcript_26496/m.44738 type:complete len:214 (-) Transcript_26496:952-1593(-)
MIEFEDNIISTDCRECTSFLFLLFILLLQFILQFDHHLHATQLSELLSNAREATALSEQNGHVSAHVYIGAAGHCADQLLHGFEGRIGVQLLGVAGSAVGIGHEASSCVAQEQRGGHIGRHERHTPRGHFAHLLAGGGEYLQQGGQDSLLHPDRQALRTGLGNVRKDARVVSSLVEQPFLRHHYCCCCCWGGWGRWWCYRNALADWAVVLRLH